MSIVANLIASEEWYITTLDTVVNGYIVEYFNENSEVPVPKELKNYDVDSIFGNITEIYEWHKNYFLEALRENSDSICGLSKVFIQNKSQFDMYQKYISNVPISIYQIAKYVNYFDQIREKLDQIDGLRDFMIAPVQRIYHYAMLLNEIFKQLRNNDLVEDTNTIKQACSMMEGFRQEFNNLPNFTEVNKFDSILLDQGKLLHCGALMCIDDGKYTQLYVFLFKRLILFTEKKQENKYQKTYTSCLQIPINKLVLKELNNRRFSLEVMDPNMLNCNVICESHTEDHHIKWLQIIKQQIDALN